VNDDGLPDPPGALFNAWTQVSGPGTVVFGNAAQPAASATLPVAGTYVLRLTANDGQFGVSDDVALTVEYPKVPLTLVATGSVWKYLDNGSDQGVAWRDLGFNDASWKSGPAPLGYGDANGQFPATTNQFGPDANNKYVTTYYRRTFNAANVSSLTNLVMKVQRDDGVVVYLNGVGAFTNNMPETFNYLTLATAAIGGGDETTFYSQPIEATLMREGTNLLAAEIHQATANSSDIVFDLELTGEGFPVNTIGQPEPLQLLTPQFSGSATPVLHLKFLALAGFTYSVQYRNSLTTGKWLKLTDVNAPDVTQVVEATDPGTTNATVRYYRVVSPRQP
jgi:hypothetical protein